MEVKWKGVENMERLKRADVYATTCGADTLTALEPPVIIPPT